MTSPARPLQVLVVDDSAVVRQTLSALFALEGIAVTVAADPYIAMEKMGRQRPDVIVLDLELPRMHGLTFLGRIMAEDPIPVVVCSALTGDGTDAAMRALEAGAVAVVTKPRLNIREFLHESAVLFLDAVRGAAQARVGRPRAAAAPRLTADAVLPARRGPASGASADRIVALGASTGGTEALTALLPALPADGPAVVVVQHMPEGFTAAFATRLNGLSRMEVREAVEGDILRPGLALIAPGNRHVVVRRRADAYAVELSDGPLVSRHRPSVDVLFRSVAQAAGPAAIGVLMTGMGDDGAQGLLELKQSGAETLAQDEASCVVFGMPREAIARGAVDEVVALERLAATILKRAARAAAPGAAAAARGAGMSQVPPEARRETLQKLVGELAGKTRSLSAELAEQVERLARQARELEEDLGAAQSLLSEDSAAPAAVPGNGNGDGSARPVADLERENRDFARRCVQLEEHSANLANLYAATYQLHATLEPDAVVNCIVEISVNLIGAAEFALYLLEEPKGEFALRIREGDLPPEITHLPEPVYPLEQAAVAEKRTLFAVEEQEGPICCVPLLHEEKLVGLLSIYALLSHKAAFTPLDRELLEFLSGQAAVALVSSQSHASIDRKLKTVQRVMDFIKS